MRDGDVVFMTKFTAHGDRGTFTAQPPAGKYLVFLLLGQVGKQDAGLVSAEQALRAMGWVRRDEVGP